MTCNLASTHLSVERSIDRLCEEKVHEEVHEVFHMSLLEQDTTRKGRVSKEVPELNASNEDSKEYKIEAIWDSAVYANKSESGHLPGFYYLVA